MEECYTKCPECGSRDLQEIAHDNDIVCRECGLVVCGQALLDPVTADRPNESAYWASVLVSLKNESKTFPRGHTYQAIFHYNERIAQLDCYDPDIPTEIMQQIRMVHRKNCAANREYIKQPFTRAFIEDQILAHVTWPESLQYTKHGRPRQKTPLQTFSERWIRIRYELTNMRPPLMTAEFRTAIQGLFRIVALAWPIVNHDHFCTFRTTGKCSHSKMLICRHNLPNFNWITQQLIVHLGLRSKDFQYADAYIDYLPAIDTPRRLEFLKIFWDRLFFHTQIPYYEVRPLKQIPAIVIKPK